MSARKPHVSHLASDRIETERRRLRRASAVLACLVIAANEDTEDVDCGDVALVVRGLIDTAVAALDSVELERARNDDA